MPTGHWEGRCPAAPRPGRLLPAVSLALSLWCALAGAQPNDALDPERLEPDQQREMEHLLDDLRDANLELARRTRAATILLHRAWPTANGEVRRLLIHSDDIALRRAIAQAIANTRAPDARFIEPLVELLGSQDASLRGDAAAALGRFDQASLTDLLAEMSRHNGQPLPRRLGAIQALAHHRTRTAAGALIDIAVDADEEPAARSAAFTALAQLTGIHDHGADAEAWQGWWQGVRELEAEQWQRELMHRISSRNAELDKHVAALSSRLIDAYTQVYDATGEERRPAVVQRMLGDELPEVRLKALRLVEQRLLNAQRVTDPLRASIRERLADRSAPIRAQAAIVLENLADENAAEQAAELLPAESETPVRAAYLRLLARVPQRAAVPAALRLLDAPELRTPASSFFIAAHDRELLTEEQATAVLDATRQGIAKGDGVNATTLRLLGRLGHEEDHVLVMPYLASADPQLRTAAVEGFANEAWPITPLLDHLQNPSLRSPVWKLVAKRGRTAAALAKLIDSEPPEPEAKPQWLGVIAAVAARLSPEELVKIDQALRGQEVKRPVHEALLQAAAGLNADGTSAANEEADDSATPERTTEAELLLAELYLRHREPTKAEAIFARLADRSSLTVDQRRRVEIGTLHHMLQRRAFDEAAGHTRQLLESLQSPPTDQLAGRWLDAGDEALRIADAVDAHIIATWVADLFGAQLDAASQTRLTEFKKKLPPLGVTETPVPQP